MNDWKNIRILLTGEKDGFKWYVCEYDLPFLVETIVDPSSFKQMSSNVVRLAYVDVTGTKLDGINDTSAIDELGIYFYCGCTFSGVGKTAAFFKKLGTKDDQEHWFIGEDYAHDIFGKHERLITPDDIARHLETETIPSIVKALVILDVKDPDFKAQKL